MRIRPVAIAAVLLAVAALAVEPASAANKRAVLVAIDDYAPPRTDESQAPRSPDTPVRVLPNLDGPVNDADSMRAMLLSHYSFTAENVHLLTNAAATRAAILQAIRDHLVTPARPGDTSVFFFAGHGSRVTNSASMKPGQLDSSIVPADARAGAWDILDKELQALFHEILDKGASVAAFYDSCHSGGMARAIGAKVRGVSRDARDYAELARAVPATPKRLVDRAHSLVYEAARETEEAREVPDAHGVMHGAFTLALIQTLQHVGPDGSADDVLASVKARIAERSNQRPQLEGSSERRRQPLFDAPTGAPRRARVVANSVRGSSVELLGGFALGLEVGCELRGVSARPGKAAPLLRIDRTPSPATAFASVIAGSAADVKVGDWFEVVRWTALRARLRLWMPPAAPRAVLDAALRDLATTSPSLAPWDPTRTEASVAEVRWTGTRWTAGTDAGNAGTQLADVLATHARSGTPPLSRAAIVLPPLQNLRKALIDLGGGAQSPALFVDDVAAADYILVGRRAATGTPEYAWLRPEGGRATIASGLPVLTTWLALADAARSGPMARSLHEQALRLARIKAWVSLDSSPDNSFGYALRIRREGGDQVAPDEIVRAGDRLTFELAATSDGASHRTKHYVYVFVLDSTGATTLLFPSGGANVFNHVGGEHAPTRITLPDSLVVVTEPFGADTYLLLATSDEIPQPSVLEQDGVTTSRGAARSENALQNLLISLNTSTRSATPTVLPASWAVGRTIVRTAAMAP